MSDERESIEDQMKAAGVTHEPDKAKPGKPKPDKLKPFGDPVPPPPPPPPPPPSPPGPPDFDPG